MSGRLKVSPVVYLGVLEQAPFSISTKIGLPLDLKIFERQFEIAFFH
jgi:hypothetical protein